MGRIANRIGRGLAAATAALTIPSTLLLGATPAHALTQIIVDNDKIVLGASSVNSFKAFDGWVTFSCDNASSNVVAVVSGELRWHSAATGSTGRAKIVLSYSDGTTQSVLTSVVAPSVPRSDFTVTAPATKDVLAVKLVIQRDNVDGPVDADNFGDG